MRGSSSISFAGFAWFDMAQMLRLALFSPLTLAAEPSCRFSSDTTACYSNRSGGVKGYQFEWSKHGEIHEYVSNANPAMAEIPIRAFPTFGRASFMLAGISANLVFLVNFLLTL